MNAHRRREAKAARRRKRTTGATRGKVRGPITRAMKRAEQMKIGEARILGMGEEIARQLTARGVQVYASFSLRAR